MLDVVLRCRRRSKSTGTRSHYASWLVVHRSRRVAGRCNPTHACCCDGPASVRNMFSRLHWPRGRSIPGSWMIGSLTCLGRQRFGSANVCAKCIGWFKVIISLPFFQKIIEFCRISRCPDTFVSMLRITICNNE